MTRATTSDAQVVLAADAVACAFGACLVATPIADGFVDLGARKRVVATALATTAGVLAAGAIRPTRARLATTAALNAGWVMAGLAALPRQGKPHGRVVVAAVAAGDAAAGTVQWILRSHI